MTIYKLYNKQIEWEIKNQKVWVVEVGPVAEPQK